MKEAPVAKIRDVGLKEVSEEEITKVVIDLDKDKAHSLDGFCMLYYHDCWDTVKTYSANVFNSSIYVTVIFGKALTSLFSC